MSRVLAVLTEWHPFMNIGLPALSKKVAFLLAICSAKRVSDLTLFSVDKSLYVFSETVLWYFRCILVQSPSHMSPPTCLKTCEDSRLCPVSYLKEYIARTEVLREVNMQLFISHNFLTGP